MRPSKAREPLGGFGEIARSSMRMRSTCFQRRAKFCSRPVGLESKVSRVWPRHRMFDLVRIIIGISLSLAVSVLEVRRHPRHTRTSIRHRNPQRYPLLIDAVKKEQNINS